MSGKRILLLAVAALLSATALLAIGILLAGHFGETQGRILGSTALLAGYALVALPAAVLLDQGRNRELAFATAALAAVGAALALTGLWTSADSATVGKSLATVTVAAVAAAQISALTARRKETDSPAVGRLYVASCATAVLAAGLFAVVLWSTHGDGSWRLLGALVVLDLLLVALQPIFARTPQVAQVHRFVVTVDSGEHVPLTIEGGDLAGAAAKAIHSVQHDGRRVVALEIDSEDRARVQPGG